MIHIDLLYSRYIEDMYPPPPEIYDPMYDYRHYPPYEPYMARMPYSEYNNYPGNRYDIPEDYPPPLYGNDIESRYYMRSDIPSSPPAIPPPPLPPSSSLPRKRMIYYAYLPEVVRSPPTVDYRYRSYDRSSYDPYYDYGYNYYDQPMMSGTYRRPMAERQMIAEKPAPIRHDYRTSRPLRMNDDVVATKNIPIVKEKRFDQDRSYYDDVKRYTHRRSSEYEPYY